MENFRIGICDRDREYAKQFQRTVNQRNAFSCRVFTGMKPLADYLKAAELTVILADPQTSRETGGSFQGVPVIPLVEEAGGQESGGIYKYQRVDEMLRNLQRKVWPEESSGTDQNPREEETAEAETAAVYSPIGRSGCTTLARSLTLNAGEQKGLYVGMENFTVTDPGTDPCEVLYRLKTGAAGFPQFLSESIRPSEGIQILMVSGTYLDVRDVQKTDMDALIRELKGLRRFSRIVFDLGSAVLRDWSVFSCFQRIYLPVIREADQRKKVEIFLKRMDERGDTPGRRNFLPIEVPAVDFRDPGITEAVRNAEKDRNQPAEGWAEQSADSGLLTG